MGARADGGPDVASAALSGDRATGTGVTAARVDGGVTRWLLGASAVVVLAWLVTLLVWPDAPFALTFDDAYYYLGIARNVAAGQGSTFDGLNQTNGYHPLWLALCVVAFKLGLDDLAAARAMLAVQLVVGWGGTLALLSVLIGRAAAGWPRLTGRSARRRGDAAEATGTTEPGPDRRRRAATALLTAVFALVLGNPYVVRTFVNGLESGIAVVVYAGIVFLAAGRGVGPGRDGRWLVGTSTRWRLGMAALLALAFLARTDAVLLLAAAGVWCLAEARGAARDGRPWLGPLVQLFALPGVVVVAYLAWNQATFGTPVQISGLHKRAELTPVTLLVFAGVVLVAVLLGRRAFQRRPIGEARPPAGRLRRVSEYAARTGWFAAFAVLVVGYYAVLQTQVWLWYFAPVLLELLVVLLLFVADAVEDTLAASPAKAPVAALAPLLVIFVVPLAVGLVVSIRTFSDPDVLSIQKANAEAGEWIRTNLPPDAVLASWDAGAVGYFSHAHVVNLDGVVNSREYYDASRSGAAAVRAFLDADGVRYIVNHGEDVAGEDPSIRSFIKAVWGPEAADAATVVHRQPFRYSGTTTGSAGRSSTDGAQPMNVFVYQLAPVSP
ncbi:MAG: hypothetical protein U0Q07_12530 [Acidimicrobiales bacterium]